MAHHSAELDLIFGAFADPTRRAILRRLGRGPARVTDLASAFPVSLNAVSKHLKVLERARLVRREVRGRDHLCSLNVRTLHRASRWIEETRAFWEDRLDALEHYVLAKQREARK